jgi:hypothetical protein
MENGIHAILNLIGKKAQPRNVPGVPPKRLNPHSLGRKTAFFQWAFKFTCQPRNRNPLQGKKL